MKFLVIFALISLAAACNENETIKEKVNRYAKECRTEAGVTDAEYDNRTNILPEPSNIQAMRFCIFKKWDMMNEEGRVLNDTNARKKFAALLEVSEEVAGGIVDICKGEVGSDGCETASVYAECIRTEVKKMPVSSK